MGRYTEGRMSNKQYTLGRQFNNPLDPPLNKSDISDI